MDRRDFILHAGATALAAGAGSRVLAAPGTTIQAQRVNPALVEKLNPNIISRLCRTRPNVNALTAVQLDALRHGIQVMQSRPVTDPTSWLYQAGIHGSNLSPQRALWGTCQHNSLHFLSWHRWYLYYFERILRAASGSPTLMLPYWNWTADRAVPAPFRDSTPGNTLFDSHRASGINGGALLPASAVSPTAALGQTAFGNFTSSLEASPHGAVHVSVGGDMSTFQTAGLDPIFWLHHCNIDRLWESWLGQGGGRANPADAAWRDRQFSFFDETGTQRTVKASGALATCSSMGYNYSGRRLILTSQILATQLSDLVAAKIRVPRGAVAAPSLALGGRPAEATVLLPPRSAGAVAKGTYIAFDDIDVANPEGFYEIYLNPPKGKPLDFTDPSYAGNLVLFGLTKADRAGMSGHEGMGDMPPRRVFDISRKVAQLAKQPGFDAKALRVVLVLKTPEGGGAAKPAVDAPRARVGRISVVSQ